MCIRDRPWATPNCAAPVSRSPRRSPVSYTHLDVYKRQEHNDLDEHLVKIRNLYRDQARAMTDAMAECFPAEVSFPKPSCV